MSWRLKSPLCKNLLKFVKVASVIFLYPLYIIINIRIKILRHMKMYRLIFPTFEQLRTHVSFNIQCSLTISFGVPVKNRRKLITRRVRYSLQSGFPNPGNSEPKNKNTAYETCHVRCLSRSSLSLSNKYTYVYTGCPVLIYKCNYLQNYLSQSRCIFFLSWRSSNYT